MIEIIEIIGTIIIPLIYLKGCAGGDGIITNNSCIPNTTIMGERIETLTLTLTFTHSRRLSHSQNDSIVITFNRKVFFTGISCSATTNNNTLTVTNIRK